MKPPFFPLTTKKVGTKVKILKDLFDESKGFYFGKVTGITQSCKLTVQFDQQVPHMGDNVTLNSYCFISV